MANTKKIIKNIVLKSQQRDFPGGPEVKILLFQCRAPKVSSLVWALRFCMLQIAAEKPHKNREIKVVCVCACMLIHFNRVRLCATSWSVACQVPLPMEEENVHVILQARILEWVATPSCRESSNTRIKPASLSWIFMWIMWIIILNMNLSLNIPNQKASAFRLYYKNFAWQRNF